MLDKTIQDLKNKIQQSSTLNEGKKEELLQLLSTLRDEIGDLSTTQNEESESIVKFAEASTHEALKNKKNQKLSDIALSGLKSSIEEFEISHPALTKTINQICTTLANLGI